MIKDDFTLKETKNQASKSNKSKKRVKKDKAYKDPHDATPMKRQKIDENENLDEDMTCETDKVANNVEKTQILNSEVPKIDHIKGPDMSKCGIVIPEK